MSQDADTPLEEFPLLIADAAATPEGRLLQKAAERLELEDTEYQEDSDLGQRLYRKCMEVLKQAEEPDGEEAVPDGGHEGSIALDMATGKVYLLDSLRSIEESIALADGGDKAVAWRLLVRAAELLERDQPLPPPLADYLAEALRWITDTYGVPTLNFSALRARGIELQSATTLETVKLYREGLDPAVALRLRRGTKRTTPRELLATANQVEIEKDRLERDGFDPHDGGASTATARAVEVVAEQLNISPRQVRNRLQEWSKLQWAARGKNSSP